MRTRVLSASLLAALAALPASQTMAQALCGGVGEGGIWLGGDETTSDISTSADPLQQLALILGSQSHVGLFTVSEATAVRVESEGMMDADSVLRLIDASGNMIAENDDWQGGVSSRLESNLLPGTYCVNTSSFSETSMSATVRVGRVSDHDALLVAPPPGAGSLNAVEGCAAGPDLGVLDETLVNQAPPATTPFLRFTLGEPMALSLTAENQDADPVLTLYDSTGRELASNDDADGLNSRIDQANPLAAGEYCIGVDAIGDTTLPILVTTTEYDPEAALLISVNAGEAAPPLDGSIEITPLEGFGNSVMFDRRTTSTAAWYAVTVEQPGLWVIDAISVDSSGDAWIALYDDFGRRLAMNDDSNGGRDSQIVMQLTPGLHYFALKELSDQSNSAFRVRFERWVKAN
ncbi:MAG: ABC transporter substrate-binding protein [Pseudomonadota bacterium]